MWAMAYISNHGVQSNHDVTRTDKLAQDDAVVRPGRGRGRGFWEAFGFSFLTDCPLSCTSLWLPFCLWPMQGHGADCQCVTVSQSGWSRQRWMGCGDGKREVRLLVWQWEVKCWKDLKSILNSFLKTTSVVLLLCFIIFIVVTVFPDVSLCLSRTNMVENNCNLLVLWKNYCHANLSNKTGRWQNNLLGGG